MQTLTYRVDVDCEHILRKKDTIIQQIILGAVASLIVIILGAIAIYLCCCKRKEKGQDAEVETARPLF